MVSVLLLHVEARGLVLVQQTWDVWKILLLVEVSEILIGGARDLGVSGSRLR